MSTITKRNKHIRVAPRFVREVDRRRDELRDVFGLKMTRPQITSLFTDVVKDARIEDVKKPRTRRKNTILVIKL